MSPSDQSFRLWIATDDNRTFAALAPLKVSRSPLRHEWGSITDLRAMPPVQSSPNLAGFIALAVAVLVGSAGLCLAGAPLLVIFFLVVLALGVGLAGTLSKRPSGQVVAPDLARFPEIHRALDRREEREDFRDLVELSERAGRTLPTLGGVVDPAEGGQWLAHALWEGADILSRRQQLRPQASGPQHQHAPIAAAATHTAEALAEQREKARNLWDQTNAEFLRIQTALELAAVAGENAMHDPETIVAARDAYRELGSLYGDRF